MDIKSSLVQFYAQISPTYRTANTVIPWEVSRLNLGNAMNLGSGVFTAPKDGVYHFHLTVYGNTKAFSQVLIRMNKKDIGETYVTNMTSVPFNRLLNWSKAMRSMCIWVMAGHLTIMNLCIWVISLVGLTKKILFFHNIINNAAYVIEKNKIFWSIYTLSIWIQNSNTIQILLVLKILFWSFKAGTIVILKDELVSIGTRSWPDKMTVSVRLKRVKRLKNIFIIIGFHQA